MEFISGHVLKSTGTYRCPDDIAHFKVRIRIKEKAAEKQFAWQEKAFSKAEKEFYRDERNCFTDREREYHNIICGEPEGHDDFLFSYINEEGFCPENDEVVDRMNFLENEMSNMSLDCTSEDDYDFHSSLVKAIENPVIRRRTENMYLMADFGDYFEDTWIKNEKVLCTLKYDPHLKVLQVFPDFTTTHPYNIKIRNEEEKCFKYFIENCSDDIPESIDAKEKTLIKKIHDCQTSSKEQAINLPPKNKLYVFMFLEISSGRNFEYPEVYVQYSLQLPEGWDTMEPEKLQGRTHICRAANEDGAQHFGHCIETLLEYNFVNLEKAAEFPKLPYIYFEVISKDFWDRYRTEGLCYINLPVSQSGVLKYNLKCFRFTAANPVGEMRRFFIGDCQNYKDLTWIGLPDDYKEKTINKWGTETVGTGELNVKVSLIHQSQEFLQERPENVDRTRKILFERLGSSTLIKSVEQVIREFKKARKEMLEARKIL